MVDKKCELLLFDYSPGSSLVNAFELSSDSQASLTLNAARREVERIIDDCMASKGGSYKGSSSPCSSLPWPAEKSPTCDKRLQYWRQVIEDRKRIADHIIRQTGKSQRDVLFNRSATVDHRHKEMVRRVLDYVAQLKPLKRIQSQRQQQKEGPKRRPLEIIGMPRLCQAEQSCERKVSGKTWLQGGELARRLIEKKRAIRRTMEFFPDVEHLQVTNRMGGPPPTSDDIRLVETASSWNISEDSSCSAGADMAMSPDPPEVPNEAVKINGHVYQIPHQRSRKNIEVNVHIIGEPYEEQMRSILQIRNVGQRDLWFFWWHRLLPHEMPHEMPMSDEANEDASGPEDCDFEFDKRPFRLGADESADILILYRPRSVAIVRDNWSLRIKPSFFCRPSDSILVSLCGECRPSVEYAAKLRYQSSRVMRKCTRNIQQTLVRSLVDLVPLIPPADEPLCPYRRSLNESELFECFNPGFQCRRYGDLERLKDMHRRLKKPRENATWNLHVDSLRDMVIRLEPPEVRAAAMHDLWQLLEQMQGPAERLENRVAATDEVDRCCFLYVRGLLCSGIDDWEARAQQLEAGFLKPALRRYKESLEEQKDQEESTPEGQEVRGSKANSANLGAKRTTSVELKGPTIFELKGPTSLEGKSSQSFEGARLTTLGADERAKWEQAEKRAVKEVRHCKAFRDSLYILTYSHLSKLIEDMVSVIESAGVF